MKEFIKQFSKFADAFQVFAKAVFYLMGAITFAYTSLHLHHALPMTKFYGAGIKALAATK